MVPERADDAGSPKAGTGVQVGSVAVECLQPEFLRSFRRLQRTQRVWRLEGDGIVVRPDTFVDDWDEAKKREVIEDLRRCVVSGGAVVAALAGGAEASGSPVTVGFANVDPKRFGPRDEYVELPYLHVSNGWRGCGIGRRLFALACAEARARGAEKLYISAHPADETKRFYAACGCRRAAYVHPPILGREPLDMQLECAL